MDLAISFFLNNSFCYCLFFMEKKKTLPVEQDLELLRKKEVAKKAFQGIRKIRI